MRTSPIGLGSRLANAQARQRNTHFSASDGAFDDRYSAASGFDGLRDGSVRTKGGWRVYSSGPGIFLRQLMHGVLGIIENRSCVVFDPTLSADHDGLKVTMILADVEGEITYRVQPDVAAVEVRVGSSGGESDRLVVICIWSLGRCGQTGTLTGH